MTADDITYRVHRLPSTLRTAMKEARDANGQTNTQFLAQVIDENLEPLVLQLEQLGFGRVAGAIRPARLPFSDQTLAALRDASHKVQIPATQLLQVSLATTVGETPAIAKRRCRRKKSGTQAGTTKDAGRRRSPQKRRRVEKD